ncbi:unnamed protein product, partial [Mycena citricolor]
HQHSLPDHCYREDWPVFLLWLFSYPIVPGKHTTACKPRPGEGLASCGGAVAQHLRPTALDGPASYKSGRPSRSSHNRCKTTLGPLSLSFSVYHLPPSYHVLHRDQHHLVLIHLPQKLRGRICCASVLVRHRRPERPARRSQAYQGCEEDQDWQDRDAVHADDALRAGARRPDGQVRLWRRGVCADAARCIERAAGISDSFCASGINCS